MIKSLASLLLVAPLATQLFAAPAPLTRLASADAVFVLHVDDVPRLRQAAADGAFARAWADPDIQAWLAPLREQGNWNKFNDAARAETGHTAEEVVDWIQGGILFLLRDLEGMGEPGAPSVPGFVVLADFGENAAKIESFMRAMSDRRVAKGEVREETEKYAGVTVHALLPEATGDEDDFDDDEAEGESSGSDDEPMVWAVNQGVLILSPQKTQVLATIDAQLDGGARQPLETSPRFQRLLATAGQPLDFLFILRMPPLVDLLQSTLERSAQANPNPMVPPAGAIIRGLGLDAWEEIVATAHTTKDEIVARYRLNYTAPRGLLSLLEVSNPDFPRPDWIPGHWKNVSLYRFDFGQLLPRLEQILADISPPLANMLQGVQAQFAEAKGVELKRDLFGNFGDEIVVAQHYSPGESAGAAAATLDEVPQLFAISVRDAAALERAIAAVMPDAGEGTSSPVRTRDYLDFKITSLTPPSPPGAHGATGPAPAAKAVHYSFAGGFVFIATGAPSALEEALQSLASGERRVFWDRGDIRTAVSAIPKGATSFQLQDTASILGLLVNTLEKFAQRSDGGDGDEEDEGEAEKPVRWTNPEAKPSRAVFARYFGDSVSYTVQDEHGIEAVTRLATPQP